MNELIKAKRADIKEELLSNDDLRCYIKSVSLSNIKPGNYCDDLFYWRAELNKSISISIDDRSEDYTHILFMPYRIDKKIREYAYKNRKPKRPDVDMDTGNTHPEKGSFDHDEWLKNPVIKQIVLVHLTPCGQYGPKFCSSVGLGNNVVDYMEVIPKSCYYPLIDGNDEGNLLNDDGYRLLKDIWKKIPENLK